MYATPYWMLSQQPQPPYPVSGAWRPSLATHRYQVPSHDWPLPPTCYTDNRPTYANQPRASDIFSTSTIQVTPDPERRSSNTHKLNPEQTLRALESESDVEIVDREPQVAPKLEKWTLLALERIFEGKVFIKTRPSWLRNPRTGRACELDFFCDELKLAVEVQGMQHYVYPNSWHKNRTEFEEQVYRDRLKEDLCKQAGITLVHVPFTVQQKGVEGFLRAELQRLS